MFYAPHFFFISIRSNAPVISFELIIYFATVMTMVCLSEQCVSADAVEDGNDEDCPNYGSGE